MKRQIKRSGLTLVELMVTISLIGLVMGISSGIFLGNNKIFKKGVEQYDVQSDARIALSDITSSVQYATFLEILPDNAVIPESGKLEEDEGYVYYDASVGNIIIKTKDSSILHPIGIENGSGVVFTSTSNEYTLGICINGMEDGNKFEVSSSILCLNLELYSARIGGDGTGSILHYKKVLAAPEAAE